MLSGCPRQGRWYGTCTVQVSAILRGPVSRLLLAEKAFKKISLKPDSDLSRPAVIETATALRLYEAACHKPFELDLMSISEGLFTGAWAEAFE